MLALVSLVRSIMHAVQHATAQYRRFNKMSKTIKGIYLTTVALIPFLFSSTATSTSPTATEKSVENLTHYFTAQNKLLRPTVLKLALTAFFNARQQGIEARPILTVIDYQLPSTDKRMWVLDLYNKRVLFNTLVAHGQASGGLRATDFSDIINSRQSSLGLYLTTDYTYYGNFGYSLKIKGLENGFNDKAEERQIVVHGASNVNPNYAAIHGQIGRTWGCPAVDEKLAQPIIDTIKDGSLMFAYYPDANWLHKSRFINYA